MFRIKKKTIALLLFFEAFIAHSDDIKTCNNLVPKAKEEQTGSFLSPNNKIKKSAQETDIEIKLRQKIEKQLEEQNQVKQESAKINSPSKRHSALHVSLMYIPNRFIDLTDLFTIGAGVGPEASFEITFTKWGQFGAIYGDRYFIEKAYNRQYGGGYSTSHNAAFGCWSNEEKTVDYCFGTVNPYVQINLLNSSIPCPCLEPYKSGNADFWRIGVKAGWLFDFEFAFHPVALANFFTGFVFIRLTDKQDL